MSSSVSAKAHLNSCSSDVRAVGFLLVLSSPSSINMTITKPKSSFVKAASETLTVSAVTPRTISPLKAISRVELSATSVLGPNCRDIYAITLSQKAVPRPIRAKHGIAEVDESVTQYQNFRYVLISRHFFSSESKDVNLLAGRKTSYNIRNILSGS